MSLASDTRREAMLCSAVLVLPWCCTVILIQNMNLDTSIRVFLSPSIRHWQVSVRPKHQSLWCLLPVNLPFPTNLFWPTHSNVFLQALHGDAKASLEVVPIKVSDFWELPMTLPSPTNGTWAQGYDLSHALPQLPQLHFCKQIVWTFAKFWKRRRRYWKCSNGSFFEKSLPLVPTISQQLEINLLIPIEVHIDFTFSPPFSIIWCFGALVVPGSPHHRFQPSSQHLLQLCGVQRWSVTPRTPSAQPATSQIYGSNHPKLPVLSWTRCFKKSC